MHAFDQQRLYVKTWGSGGRKPALVLVHGYPSNQDVWELVIEQLEARFLYFFFDVHGAFFHDIASWYFVIIVSNGSLLDLESVVNGVVGKNSRPFFILAAHDWGLNSQILGSH